ncbi:thiamine ABC transporter permease [Aliivibrio sp. S4TY2]|uniref:ABC transporter permease n=1 Tax=unclassified Aliivibrio TaxID=2645654 RepID=UPI002379CDA0|nr:MULTISPECIES: thiamine ABC transporter permease [unclassified Aliivibrio]MDD9155290.1 thiamine ABC transporter permease [Aliivibrio sp. S4TY2]MDD9159158.1 thiamine ABC transporter permease [Aliivibrio sp. S4TY1]MDD9163292.1 thiamine ABC transporter permease [Aliivibrio sp. S4MY2]MDD9167157.1 thiamine ABC transporter permease [Aliivibrio sp. S4MY4]MDD9184369.1 thiamine ABC transporter permease [Aliivibrio sp. S4MY3]
MLRVLYILIIVICILPTLPGLLGVALSAFGYIPPLGMHNFSLSGFAMVFDWQGVWRSISLTVYSAIASSYLACLISFSILQATWGTRLWRKIELSLSPLLAMPHIAFAIGFAFLFAPTGMGIRALHSLFGYDPGMQGVNDAVLLIKDPHALGLIIMLALKEVPFLLLMSISILAQLKVTQIEKVSASLGYSKNQMWWKCILPQWFAKLRFPMLAVIAYSLSVVDVALIIGPTNPPTFAVLVWQWFSDPDLTLLPRAAAGAVILFAIASLLIAFARLVEWTLTKGIKCWQFSGRYGISLPGKSLFITLISLTILMVPLIIMWSFAQRWRFPDLLPSRYSNHFWQLEWGSIVSTINQSLIIAVVTATITLVLALLAHEYRIKYKWQIPGYVIAIPMLIPQLSILFGLQVVTLYLSSDSYLLWVCWAHVFFAFPFVYLALDGPWRSFDTRLTRAALSLGKSPLQAWLKVKMPILLPAIVFAWAVGVSVSLAQYLPTLMLGAGRINTITTEAVALSSGFDRRVTAIYAIWQALLPLIFFSIAIIFSRVQGKYRRIST